jgi:hypothetical protein
VFSPYANPGIAFSFTVAFLFADGGTVQLQPQLLGANRRMDIRAQDVPGMLAKVNANPANRFYSIMITTTQLGAQGTIQGAAVAQLTRIHAQSSWRQTMTTAPQADSRFPLIFMDAPQFNAP